MRIVICHSEMNWDWTAFWTGVGALATVGAVVIAIIVYRRGKSRVIVQVTSHQHWLPVKVVQLFKDLENAHYELKDPDSLKAPDNQVQKLLNTLIELSNDRRLLDFLQSEHGTIWVVNVTNKGHERAEKLELQVPDAVNSMLVQSDGTHEATTSGIIRIPELRPGESVRIMSCARPSFGGPKLLQARGRAIMRFQELVPSRLAAIYNFFREYPGLILIIIFGGLLPIVVRMLLSLFEK